MKEFKKFSSFLAICLSLSIVLGNFSLPTALAYEKKDVNFEQVRTKTRFDNSGAKINSSSDSLIIKKEKTALKKSQQTEGKKKNYVEGEVLVKYKNNKINLQTALGRTTALNFIRSKSLEKKEDLIKINTSVLRIKDSTTVEQKVAELKNDPNIEYVEPNYKRYPAAINTNDTNKGLLWGLDNVGQSVNGVSGTNDADIDAPEAWEINEGTNFSTIVAVIDSGVAYNHPDLLANMWDGTGCKDENGNSLGGCNHGYDYEDNDKTPLPTDSSHGTHIAGTIAAIKNNSKGIIGVAPQAKIMAIKYNETVFNEIKAIDFAIQNGAKIINASFAGASFSQSEFDAINRFKIAGGIFVAAAGNESTNNESVHSYPSDYNLDNIISVAATDQNDSLATFSNYGATSVDVGAPGTNIYSTEGYRIFDENFEGVTPPNIGTKFTQSGSNTWGTKSSIDGLDKAIFGDYAYWGNYRNNILSNIDSSAINLSGKPDSYLNFDIFCDSEPDYDGIILYFWNGSSWVVQEVYSGSGSLSEGKSLSSFAINNFKFRFAWSTNGSNPISYEGCYVDNIKIIDSASLNESYQFMDGTSMATPHVAGLAALIEGYNPNLTTSQVKNIILTTGDSLASLSGKAVSGKRINAQKALQAATPLSSNKAITSFSFAGLTPSVIGIINEIDHTIALAVPLGTDVTALIPTIVITGSSVSPASNIAQNFTNPVTYTVTAADSSTQAYTVTVNAVAVIVDLATLTTAIISAQTLHNGAIEGANPGEYAIGSKAILQAAIDAASAIKDNPASTQANVDVAVIALNAAVVAFEAGIVPTPDITPPSSPTINSVTSPTQNSTQTISGTKEADTSVWLNGSQIVPLDSLTTWSYNTNLVSGSNNFQIIAKDASGNESAAVVATIIYNPPSPPAPNNQSSSSSNSSSSSSSNGNDSDDEESPPEKTTPQVARASILSSDRIKSLYQKIFNRIPKSTELNYWVNVKGYSLNEIKKTFYNSNEYNKKIKDLANKQGKKKGIEKLFQDIFGRSIKKNDLAYWSKQDTSILGIKFLFLSSKEYKTNSEDKQRTERRNQIASLYRSILMRPPDQNGLNYWDKTKKPLKQIRTTMLNSAEFKNLLKNLEKQKGREVAFEQLFEAVFNSPADGKNYNYYVQKNKKIDLQKAKVELMQSRRYQRQNW